jgi:SPP1 gp7 family putative phage head morphogenesis protein
VTPALRRQASAVRAVERAAGSAGSLADLAARHAAAIVDSDIPAARKADAVAAVASQLRALTRARLRDDLARLALRGHALTARLVTRQARGRPIREELWLPDADDYDAWIVDAPSRELIRLLVGPAPDRLTTLIDPQAAANAVYAGVSYGKDRRAIAADLRDLFGGFGQSARRVARTEGLRVATESQLAASESVAHLIAGYICHATLDSRTRPEHRKRDGTTYWRNPRPGQKGFAEMPRPPYDADGTLCYNCRCFVVPRFHD